MATERETNKKIMKLPDLPFDIIELIGSYCIVLDIEQEYLIDLWWESRKSKRQVNDLPYPSNSFWMFYRALGFSKEAILKRYNTFLKSPADYRYCCRRIETTLLSDPSYYEYVFGRKKMIINFRDF